MNVISVDPGTQTLSISIVQFPNSILQQDKKGTTLNDETNYKVLWSVVLDLNSKNTDNNDDVYKSMTAQILALDTYFSFVFNDNTIIKKKNKMVQYELNCIKSKENEHYHPLEWIMRKSQKNNIPFGVIFEQTEGIREFNILLKLIRVNFVSGYLSSLLKQKYKQIFTNDDELPLFRFLPKTSKWAYSQLNKISKEKYLTWPSSSTRVRKIPFKITKERMRKQRKLATSLMIRKTILQSPLYSQKQKMIVSDCKFDHFNHMADSISQAMVFIKKYLLVYHYKKNVTVGKKKQQQQHLTSTSLSEPLKSYFDSSFKSFA